MSIINLEHIAPSGKHIAYEEGFKQFFLDYLELSFIPDADGDKVERVEPAEAYMFQYNFYGLLRYKNEPIERHWYIARLNRILYPFQNIREMRSYRKLSDAKFNYLIGNYKQMKIKLGKK